MILSMKENVIQIKSYAIALRIVGLYKFLVEDKKEYILSKQLLRSGTSIGANVEEAVGGQSRKDFISKLSVAYKEARETRYWVRLLNDTRYIEKNLAESILFDCDEICKIIGKIQITIKNNS